MRIRIFGIPVFSGILLAACGDGGSGLSGVNLDIEANPAINTTTSYVRQTRGIEAGLDVNPFDLHTGGTFLLAWTLMDLNNDGELDLVMASGVVPGQGDSADNPTLTPFTAWENIGGGLFNSNNDLLGTSSPTGIHPRKAVAMDFTGNGLDDLVVFDHGYDLPPFPGAPVIYLQQNSAGAGLEQVNLFRSGFHHCGAAGDIDNDGDIDVLVGGHSPFFLVNDGDGNLNVVTNRLSGLGNQVFTCEMVDVDGDGFLDIIAGGHEFDGMATAVFWGDSSGTWTSSRRTIIPAVSGWGVIIDIEAEDVAGDGDGRRDLIITRTGGGTSTTEPGFYKGIYIQLLMQGTVRTFADETAERIDYNFSLAQFNCSSSSDWIDWMVAVEGNDGIDIRPLNPGCNLLWENEGTGYFTLTGSSAAGFISAAL